MHAEGRRPAGIVSAYYIGRISRKQALRRPPPHVDNNVRRQYRERYSAPRLTDGDGMGMRSCRGDSDRVSVRPCRGYREAVGVLTCPGG